METMPAWVVLLLVQVGFIENSMDKMDASDAYNIPTGINLLQFPPGMKSLLEKKHYTTAILEYIDYVQDIPENCSVYTTLVEFDYDFFRGAYARYGRIEEGVELVANTMTDLFSIKKDAKNIDAIFDDDLYYSQAKSLLHSDDRIHAVTIGFDFMVYRNKSSPYFCPYVYKTKAGVPKQMDLRSLCTLDTSVMNKWFTAQERFATTRKSIEYKSSIDSLTEVTLSKGLWTAPFFDCNGSNAMTTSFSLPFYGHEQNSDVKTFKGAIGVHINLDSYDINQCVEDGSSFFGGTHRCKPETTQCEHVAGGGFRRGSYVCQCKPGYVFPGQRFPNNQSYFNGSDVETQYMLHQLGQASSYDTDYQCIPCKTRCEGCATDGLCYVELSILLRGIPLGVQSFCITVAIVMGCVILYKRGDKVFKLSMWPLLELMVIGAIFIYVTVIVMYFEPTTETCLLIPWLREVGFAVLYGVLLLKVYRVLAEFQTRKARRVHVRDKDLLKYLLVVVVVVIGYMASWTAVNMERHKFGLTQKIQAENGLWFQTCKSSWWNYFVEISEFLFTLFGLYLCYCVRGAPADYNETKHISLALCNELVGSAAFHVARHFLNSWLHPDYMFLIYFIRCQLTVSITLALMIAPKLWYAHKPKDFRGRAFSTCEVLDSILPESMKLQLGVSANGDADVAEVNISEMDPEDIRLELKRLYTQLQIYKTKNMRKDNPHISKRKGGKKQGNRRFSLQPFAHQKHKSISRDHDHDVGEILNEITKTPEESTISGEVFLYDFDNKRSDGPTVTFKAGTKH